MRHFQTPDGQIRAIEKGQEHLIEDDWGPELTTTELQAKLNPPVPVSDLAARQRTTIENARKTAEATGVTVNAIRYAGDAGNRAALREAVDFADAAGLTTFASWKDSDDQFHANHLVADVRQALSDIAARRGQLIAREGELVADINAAEQAEDREALGAIEWTFTES